MFQSYRFLPGVLPDGRLNGLLLQKMRVAAAGSGVPAAAGGIEGNTQRTQG